MIPGIRQHVCDGYLYLCDIVTLRWSAVVALDVLRTYCESVASDADFEGFRVDDRDSGYALILNAFNVAIDTHETRALVIRILCRDSREPQQ